MRSGAPITAWNANTSTDVKPSKCANIGTSTCQLSRHAHEPSSLLSQLPRSPLAQAAFLARVGALAGAEEQAVLAALARVQPPAPADPSGPAARQAGEPPTAVARILSPAGPARPRLLVPSARTAHLSLRRKALQTPTTAIRDRAAPLLAHRRSLRTKWPIRPRPAPTRTPRKIQGRAGSAAEIAEFNAPADQIETGNLPPADLIAWPASSRARPGWAHPDLQCAPEYDYRR